MTRTRSSLTYRTLLALALLCGISIGSLSAVAAVPANADISTTAPAWHAGWKLPTPNKGIIKFSNNAKRDMQIYFHELNALNRPVSGAKSRFRFALGGWNNGKSFAAVDEAASGSTYDYHIEGIKILGPDGNPYSAGPSQAGLTGTAQEYWCAYDEGLFIIGRGKTVNAASIIFLHKATPKTATHFGFSSYDGTQKFTNIRVEPLPANPFWKNATIPVGSSHNYAANEQKQIFTLPGSGYVKFDLFGSKKSEIELKDKDGGFVARVLIGYAGNKISISPRSGASHASADYVIPPGKQSLWLDYHDGKLYIGTGSNPGLKDAKLLVGHAFTDKKPVQKISFKEEGSRATVLVHEQSTFRSYNYPHAFYRKEVAKAEPWAGAGLHWLTPPSSSPKSWQMTFKSNNKVKFSVQTHIGAETSIHSQFKSAEWGGFGTISGHEARGGFHRHRHSNYELYNGFRSPHKETKGLNEWRAEVKGTTWSFHTLTSYNNTKAYLATTANRDEFKDHWLVYSDGLYAFGHGSDVGKNVGYVWQSPFRTTEAPSRIKFFAHDTKGCSIKDLKIAPLAASVHATIVNDFKKKISTHKDVTDFERVLVIWNKKGEPNVQTFRGEEKIKEGLTSYNKDTQNQKITVSYKQNIINIVDGISQQCEYHVEGPKNNHTKYHTIPLSEAIKKSQRFSCLFKAHHTGQFSIELANNIAKDGRFEYQLFADPGYCRFFAKHHDVGGKLVESDAREQFEHKDGSFKVASTSKHIDMLRITSPDAKKPEFAHTKPLVNRDMWLCFDQGWLAYGSGREIGKNIGMAWYFKPGETRQPVNMLKLSTYSKPVTFYDMHITEINDAQSKTLREQLAAHKAKVSPSGAISFTGNVSLPAGNTLKKRVDVPLPKDSTQSWVMTFDAKADTAKKINKDFVVYALTSPKNSDQEKTSFWYLHGKDNGTSMVYEAVGKDSAGKATPKRWAVNNVLDLYTGSKENNQFNMWLNHGSWHSHRVQMLSGGGNDPAAAAIRFGTNGSGKYWVAYHNGLFAYGIGDEPLDDGSNVGLVSRLVKEGSTELIHAPIQSLAISSYGQTQLTKVATKALNPAKANGLSKALGRLISGKLPDGKTRPFMTTARCKNINRMRKEVGLPAEVFTDVKNDGSIILTLTHDTATSRHTTMVPHALVPVQKFICNFSAKATTYLYLTLMHDNTALYSSTVNDLPDWANKKAVTKGTVWRQTPPNSIDYRLDHPATSLNKVKATTNSSTSFILGNQPFKVSGKQNPTVANWQVMQKYWLYYDGAYLSFGQGDGPASDGSNVGYTWQLLEPLYAPVTHFSFGCYNSPIDMISPTVRAIKDGEQAGVKKKIINSALAKEELAPRAIATKNADGSFTHYYGAHHAWRDAWEMPEKSSGIGTFNVDVSNDINVSFHTTNSADPAKFTYEMIVGGWANSQSIMRRDSNYALVEGSLQKKPPVLPVESGKEKPYWVRIDNGKFSLGSGSAEDARAEKNIIYTWTDPSWDSLTPDHDAKNLKYMTIRSWKQKKDVAAITFKNVQMHSIDGSSTGGTTSTGTTATATTPKKEEKGATATAVTTTGTTPKEVEAKVTESKPGETKPEAVAEIVKPAKPATPTWKWHELGEKEPEQFVLMFNAKAADSLQLVCANAESETGVYTLELGKSKSAGSHIYKGGSKEPYVTFQETSIARLNTPINYWLAYNKGRFYLGQGINPGRDVVLLDWQDTAPAPFTRCQLRSSSDATVYDGVSVDALSLSLQDTMSGHYKAAGNRNVFNQWHSAWKLPTKGSGTILFATDNADALHIGLHTALPAGSARQTPLYELVVKGREVHKSFLRTLDAKAKKVTTSASLGTADAKLADGSALGDVRLRDDRYWVSYDGDAKRISFGRGRTAGTNVLLSHSLIAADNTVQYFSLTDSIAPITYSDISALDIAQLGATDYIARPGNGLAKEWKPEWQFKDALTFDVQAEDGAVVILGDPDSSDVEKQNGYRLHLRKKYSSKLIEGTDPENSREVSDAVNVLPNDGKAHSFWLRRQMTLGGPITISLGTWKPETKKDGNSLGDVTLLTWEDVDDPISANRFTFAAHRNAAAFITNIKMIEVKRDTSGSASSIRKKPEASEATPAPAATPAVAAPTPRAPTISRRYKARSRVRNGRNISRR